MRTNVLARALSNIDAFCSVLETNPADAKLEISKNDTFSISFEDEQKTILIFSKKTGKLVRAMRTYIDYSDEKTICFVSNEMLTHLQSLEQTSD